MCAYELGHPEVSELQSCGLVTLRRTDFAGVEWRIEDAGRAALGKNGTMGYCEMCGAQTQGMEVSSDYKCPHFERRL